MLLLLLLPLEMDSSLLICSRQQVRDAKEESSRRREKDWRKQARRDSRERKRGTKEHPYTLEELPRGDSLPKNWTSFVRTMLLGRLNVTK